MYFFGIRPIFINFQSESHYSLLCWKEEEGYFGDFIVKIT